jgi:hypothetical protein
MPDTENARRWPSDILKANTAALEAAIDPDDYEDERMLRSYLLGMCMATIEPDEFAEMIRAARQVINPSRSTPEEPSC